MRLDDRSFKELLKIGKPTIAKCKKQSLPVSVFHYATLLGHKMYSETRVDHRFSFRTAQLIHVAN